MHVPFCVTFQVKNSKKREQRAKDKLSSVLQLLKETQSLNVEQMHQLEAYSNIPIDLFSKNHNMYTDEQRRFAVTLHLYSSKAYEFVRKHIPLPSPRSLRR